MSIQTSTGVKIYISTQLPATFDLAGYGVLTWTEIKEVTNIVPPSPSYQVVTHEPLKSGITQKNKGFVDYGDPTIDYALDTSDTGQQMLQSAASGATKNLEHSFKLTYPNGDIRYFSGRVFSSLEGGFSANSMVSGTSNVGVSRAIVKIPAISFAANYITNTYSILGESKTFADAHTFTRSTTATFIGSNGLIQSAAIDAPRFQYDPVTLAPKGLLIEGARTNLLTYSEQFDNASWVKNGGTITANNTTSPDGSVTADKLVESSSNEVHQALKTINFTSGTSYTLSGFAKASERNLVRLQIGSAAFPVDFYCEFNLSTGSIVGAGSGASSYSMESFGNGWYRCSITATATATLSETARFYILDSPLSTVYTGDGTSGIYIWGAQLEAGSFASSYIPTTTAQVTRTADVCTAKEFTSWYNQGEGSVFVGCDTYFPPTEGGRVFVTMSDGTVNSRYQLRKESGNQNISVINTVGGLSSTILQISGVSSEKIKVASTLKTGSMSISLDKVGIESEISIIGTFSLMSIGSNFNALSDQIYGTIAQLNYYPTALSDEALQDLTR